MSRGLETYVSGQADLIIDYAKARRRADLDGDHGEHAAVAPAHAFIDATNAAPKPFRWSKSADNVLASVRRFCPSTLGAATADEPLSRTSESGH